MWNAILFFTLVNTQPQVPEAHLAPAASLTVPDAAQVVRHDPPAAPRTAAGDEGRG